MVKKTLCQRLGKKHALTDLRRWPGDGFFAKSEFRPRWKSGVGIPTLGGAGSAGWRLRCQAGGWCTRSAKPYDRTIRMIRMTRRAGMAPMPGRDVARAGDIEASTLSAGWRGSDAGQGMWRARYRSLHVVGVRSVSKPPRWAGCAKSNILCL